MANAQKTKTDTPLNVQTNTNLGSGGFRLPREDELNGVLDDLLLRPGILLHHIHWSRGGWVWVSSYMEKAHVAAGGPFCCVHRHFYTVLSVAAPIFGCFYSVLPEAASKFIFLLVIGSPDHRAFPCMGFI